MIRRKVFSYVEPEEERLYSTGNEELDDLLERAFSEGYEYAQKLYTADGDLTIGDKVDIALKKHLTTKKDKEALIEALEEGKYHKLGKQTAKYGGAGGALAGIASGAAIGSKYGRKGALLGGTVGAALGSGLGAGSGYVATRIGGATRNIVRKISGSADTIDRMEADRVKVASGKMTKKEFREKWRGAKDDD